MSGAAQVKHRVGLRRMRQLLPEALMRSARAGLRWSGSLCEVSMYCALLLKVSREAAREASSCALMAGNAMQPSLLPVTQPCCLLR